MARGKSLAAYRREARKCVLVCANCHGEIEARLIPSPPSGAKFGEDSTVNGVLDDPPGPVSRPTPPIEQFVLFENEDL